MSSTLGEFDRVTREHHIPSTAYHVGMWDGWCLAKFGSTLPYPGTEEHSNGATCKGCGGVVNRADSECPHCHKYFPPDPDYPEGT